MELCNFVVALRSPPNVALAGRSLGPGTEPKKLGACGKHGQIALPSAHLSNRSPHWTLETELEVPNTSTETYEGRLDSNQPLGGDEARMKFPTNWKTAFGAVLMLAGLPCAATAAELKKPAVPAASIAASGPDYRLGPEDVIDVFVWKEPDLSTTVVIRPDGKISLPLANELEASGKTATELQQEITERMRRYVTQPIVNVMVKQINSLKISVLGEVRKPDVYRIKNRVTVLDAIAMAGGFTDLARPNRVIVLRNTASGSQRIKINVKQTVADDAGAPFYLQPQDTVYVEGR